MAVVGLNRRFYEWGDNEPPDPEFRRAMGLDDGGVGWEELLAKRRVVILAEAGSGKSTEIGERVRLSAACGRFTFHATVEDVGRDGLEGSLSSGSRGRFSEWLASTDDAWFFLDSVDEAKLSGIRLEKVLRRLADGIQGAEQRTHIILSGRITDWEFRRDLKCIKDWLPAVVRVSEPGRTPEEELLRIVRQEVRREKDPPNAEQPFVALMAPLDRDRVRLFAAAKSAPNVDQFLEHVEAANLWHFARRPLDLDWLVRSWQSDGRLGSLTEMVERSMSERLKETNPDRARADTLDSARALKAVERIAATMVFSRRTTIAIPDRAVAFSADSPLDLADVLPDWAADDRALLLSRPIFDPATLGRARFHNDNEGVVRGYLTARWLVRLRNANLSTTALFDLLFAKSYGLEVVRPSLTETVAWLALWDKDVSREVVGRSPSLLLGVGDPASLPVEVRRNALVGLIKELTTTDHERSWDERPWWDDDKLRRFSQPDLGSVVKSLWPECRGHEEATQLLLRIVWLGALKDCASLATEAAYDAGSGSITRFLAGRALFATGGENAKKQYAEFVLAEGSRLPSEVVRDAMTELFPTLIGVGDLLDILGSIDIADDRGGPGFALEAPRLVEKLDSLSDLQQLLDGLLMQLGGELGEYAHDEPTKREEAYFPAIVTAALRLLKVSPPEIAPQVAVDAILRVANRRNDDSETKSALSAALTEIQRTTSRRRFAFWRVVQNLRSPPNESRKIEQLWQLESLGYQAGLQVQDVEWLLEDGPTRGEHDRRLAINTALAIQRSTGAPAALLEKIAAAANTDAVTRAAYETWMRPQQPLAERTEMDRAIEEAVSQSASEKAKRDESWLAFIRELRTDPARIARLNTPPTSVNNPELLQLFRLLDGASGKSRYAIDSVAPLVRIAGTEVAEAVREGLIAHWRSSTPQLNSQKDVTDRNTVRWVDLMGLTGVSLEVASQDGWAHQLSAHEATLAARYAMLELNRLPQWLSVLAASKPTEVRAVLVGEISDELSRPEPTHYPTLSKVAYADDGIATLVVPALLDEIETRVQLPTGALSHVLQIIVRGTQQQSTPRFVNLGIKRFENETDAAVAVEYLAAVFSLEAAMATNALATKLASLGANERATLVDGFVSVAFGGSRSGSALKPGEVPAETLEQLVHLTFQTNTQTTAPRRPAGKVYKPDERDRADFTRSVVFNRFVKTPGAFTFQALLRLQDDPTCPIAPATLRTLAEDRAVQDSESTPWVPSEALAFEQHHETAPRTPKDLQCVLLRRLEDIQHDLLHGDFAQGLTLKALPDEVDVQNWVADRLRLKQGRSFSVEREPHVADEKEPDVRVRAKGTDANVAIEIKVAESWSLKQLEEALEAQLCGRYLRAKDGRYGVLLFVHQNARPKGWEDTNSGVFLSFSKVAARVSARAALIAGAHDDSPQPEVCALDVSSCVPKR